MGTVQPVLVSGVWRQARNAEGTFTASNPRTGAALDDQYPVSSFDELNEMLDAAVGAAEQLDGTPVERRVRFFELYAAAIERDREALAEVAHVETALPVSPRLLDVEIPRTVRQLRMAADVLRNDDWRGRVVDPAANMVSEFHPLGAPVLVIGPNNFPFAFNGISGGDFVAALAAGNPVIAKAHPLHAGVSRMLAVLCAACASEAGLPAAAVQFFYRCSPGSGLRLAGDQRLGAVAFTGSRDAGLRLKAAADPVGVLFYGELSAANPVFLLPAALAENGDAIARDLFASFTVGCGQFCTRPAVVPVLTDPAGERFLETLRSLVTAASSQVLLGRSVRDRFRAACGEIVQAGASRTAEAKVTLHEGFTAEPVLFETTGTTFLAAPGALQHEAFGPMTLVVRVADEEEFARVARVVEGTLVATVYQAASGGDAALLARLRPLLLRRCGRFTVNKMPTGVTVSPAMNHGGPWPATTHPGFTAVGLPRSMQRFLALKCWDPAQA
jgi:2,5-dioxopentanoate dehydrogenase